MERICRWPFIIVLERTQNPSITRQHSVGRSPSETMARPASHERTIIGSARMAAMSASSSPVTAFSRRNKVATINSLSKPDTPSHLPWKTDAPGRGSQQRLRMRPLRRGMFTSHRRSAVKKKRNRSRPALSFQERLKRVRISRARKSRRFAAGPRTRPSDTDSGLQ